MSKHSAQRHIKNDSAFRRGFVDVASVKGVAFRFAIIPEKFSPLVFDGKLHLGMSRSEVVTALGPPSKSEAAQIAYSHEGKLANGFDETAWIILRFREDKLVSMRGGKTTTN